MLKYSKRIARLDKIRQSKGIDELKATFSDLAKNNAKMATELINDKNLRFGTLFLLESEIKMTKLYNYLNQRNRTALELSNGLLLNEISNSERFYLRYKQEDYSVLRWILESGYIDDGLHDQYDQVLDDAAILLAKVYKDKNSMSLIEDMIFNRYRRGAFIYDLVWVFFETSDYQNLISICKRLRSSNPKDVELASTFLNFIPCIDLHSKEKQINKYRCAVQWIKLNKDSLYYTGETCLQGTNPHRYAVAKK